MDLKEIGINTRNWVDSAQGRNYWKALVNAALNIRVPLAMELVNYHCISIKTQKHKKKVSVCFKPDYDISPVRLLRKDLNAAPVNKETPY